MSKSYDTLIREKQQRRVAEAIERDKNWWRSLSASEKEAGFCSWKWHVFPYVFVKVPIPYPGYCDVVVIGLGGRVTERKTPTEAQLDWLRGVVRRGTTADVIVEKRDDAVTTLWKPTVAELAIDTRFEGSYGFITVA